MQKPIEDDFYKDDGDPRGVSTSQLRQYGENYRKALELWEQGIDYRDVEQVRSNKTKQ